MMLKASNLGFHYRNGKNVLEDISFELHPGEILCILGPNGTGKTTLLNCLLGLRKPKSGQVTINGKNISELNQKERSKFLAYVPQFSGLSFAYEVWEVVMMGRVSHIYYGASHNEKDREIVLAALEKLGIAQFANRKYQELSGGEKQMVLIARAIVQQASYLIMDEPTASLDYGNQIKVLRAIKMLAKEGYGILMTSHNPDHAFLACTNTLLMKDGYIRQSGSPDETVTTETLTGLYATPVAVSTANAFGKPCKTCIPLLDDAVLSENLQG